MYTWKELWPIHAKTDGERGTAAAAPTTTVTAVAAETTSCLMYAGVGYWSPRWASRGKLLRTDGERHAQMIAKSTTHQKARARGWVRASSHRRRAADPVDVGPDGRQRMHQANGSGLTRGNPRGSIAGTVA